MKIIIKLLFISFLINCVYLRKFNQIYRLKNEKFQKNGLYKSELINVTPSYQRLNLEDENLEQNQHLVKQLIDELTNNLHNKTLVNKIRSLNDEKNDHHQLISNLTGNLANKDPLMSEYLDQKLKTYLLKVQQQSFNQTIDLMEILRQFKDIVSISNFNLTNEFELINKTTGRSFDSPMTNKQDDFELIYSKNSSITDLNSTKLSRMEFLTDTLISLLIGKLIGLKIGFFAGKLISNVPFSLKKQCCQTNTWPSDSPGLEPTQPTNIIRNQFISMKKDEKKIGSDSKIYGNKPNIKQEESSKSGNKKKIKNIKPTVTSDVASEEDEDWRTIDDEEELEEIRSTTRKPSRFRHKLKNKYSYDDFDKKVEESLDNKDLNNEDLEDLPNQEIFNFKQYHPVYSTIDSSSKNSYSKSLNHYPFYLNTNTPSTFYSTTTNLPSTTIQLHPTAIQNRKHYMLLTGK